jgi:hypothetical protein
VGGYLQRRGFSYDVVMAATRSVWAEVSSSAESEEELVEPEL